MLNIGPAELLVVMVVALLVLGPNKLPDAARQVGRAIGEMRKLTSGFQAEMRDALKEPIESKPTSGGSIATTSASTGSPGTNGALAAPRAPTGEADAESGSPSEVAEPGATESARVPAAGAAGSLDVPSGDVPSGPTTSSDEPEEPGTDGVPSA